MVEVTNGGLPGDNNYIPPVSAAADYTNGKQPTIPKITMTQSHEGEHSQNYSGRLVPITARTYAWAACAAVNSCNLGYDIGVNTGAGPLVKDVFGLSDARLEFFFGSLNLFSMVGAMLAQHISDKHGRRKAFTVSVVWCGVVLGHLLQTHE